MTLATTCIGFTTPICAPPKEFTIDVTRRLASQNSQVNSFKAEANILQLKVKDGRVYYGDQQLGDRDQRAIAQACAEMMKRFRSQGITNIAQYYTSEHKYSKEAFARFARSYLEALKKQEFWNF